MDPKKELENTNKLYERSETGCCPKFNPEPWDEKEVTFKSRLFLKDRVRAFLHIPLNFGKVMVKNMEKIRKANALIPEPLMLSDEASLWRSNIYVAVSKEVPGAKIVRLSGNFLTKVFEGEYRNMKRWIEEMKNYVKSKDKKVKKMYFFYTTCPRCAKYYGKNYTVILAEFRI
jgi:hypothetical protein